MYGILKDLHNIVRWFVLLFGVWAVLRAWWGVFSKREWVKGDRLAGILFSSALDTQVLLGLILYFVSPIIQGAFKDLGAAMSQSGTRFFTIEHVVYMILAVVFAHVGSASTKKAPTTQTRFKRATLWFSLALALVLAGIPWPWLEIGRSLLPGFLTP